MQEGVFAKEKYFIIWKVKIILGVAVRYLWEC